MVDNVFVSVLMTAYNREIYLAEAIESVVRQSYKNFELIIVDDCSSDNTAQIAADFQRKDSRIKLFVNEHNLGDYPNRNKAASYANGELFVYVDSDDTIEFDALEYIVYQFHRFPQIDFMVIYQGGTLSDNTILSPKESIKFHFFESSILHIGPGGTVIRSSLFKKINGFSKFFGPATDMYYNLEVASMCNVLFHKKNYLYYRRHPGQEINNSFGYLYQGYLYLNEAVNCLDLPLDSRQKKMLLKKNKRRFFVNIIRYYFKTWSFTEIRKALSLTHFGIRDMLIAIFQ